MTKDADLKKIAAIASTLPSIAQDVANGETIYAGVAFGTDTWEKLCKLKNQKLPENFGHTKVRKKKLQKFL